MEPREPNSYIKNITLAAMAGQSGCATTVIVIGALLLGLWLDSVFGTKPAFTLGLILTSIPLSLVMMVYTTLNAAKRMTPTQKRSTQNNRESK